MNENYINSNSRILFSAGESTIRASLPVCAEACVRLLEHFTNEVLRAGNTLVSATICDSNGKRCYADKFKPWELLHDRRCEPQTANSYTLGVTLFVMMFRRFPTTAEQQLHRSVDYSSVVLKDADTAFFEAADEFLRNSLCISAVCRKSTAVLSEIVRKM